MIRSGALLGYVYAVGASAGLGAAIALSRAAYNGGTDPISVASVRGVLGVLLVGAFSLSTGRSIRLPPRDWCHCMGLGALMSMAFYGNIGAVEYIPVGLAALLFFIYPPLVAVIIALLDRKWLGWITAISLAMSFVGLGVMLGVSLDAVDWRGVALSLAAGTACALNVVWVGRVMRHVDVFVMTFHMMTAAAAVLVGLMLLSGGLNPPETTEGWLGAGGVVLCQAASIPFFYAAIPRIGAENTSILNNLQPVVSIGLAWILFSETLSLVQGLGGAMVIGGILLMQSRAARQRSRTVQGP
jgi:drug/metabolite transporter (DMT)-like permease